MADPWLHIIGIHPAGLASLGAAARRALDDASVVFGSPRHLALAQVGARGQPWPVPFSVAPVLALRGQAPVAVLASGDPFHHGAGASLARHLQRGEWCNHPQPSTFALLAGELGWPLEHTHCLGLHARPLATLAPRLAEGARFICLLRDGPAATALAQWLHAQGWGDSPLWLRAAVGGPAVQRLDCTAREAPERLHAQPLPAPLAAAFEARGGLALSQTPGRPVAAFAHDGQISKPPVRAITLAALAPRPGECLWDLGAGSGAVAVEWCLASGGRAVRGAARRARGAHHPQRGPLWGGRARGARRCVRRAARAGARAAGRVCRRWLQPGAVRCLAPAPAWCALAAGGQRGHAGHAGAADGAAPRPRRATDPVAMGAGRPTGPYAKLGQRPPRGAVGMAGVTSADVMSADVTGAGMLRVALGWGFRAQAGAGAFAHCWQQAVPAWAALMQAGGADEGRIALRLVCAVLAEKAPVPAFAQLRQWLARALPAAVWLPCHAAALHGQHTAHHSPRVQARFGTGSLCEALALHGARHGVSAAAPARLLLPRRVSGDGQATLALAICGAPPCASPAPFHAEAPLTAPK